MSKKSGDPSPTDASGLPLTEQPNAAPPSPKIARIMDRAAAEELILTAALEHTACVLRPFPQDIAVDVLEPALESLRARELVHGSRREPSLTRRGVEFARSLTA